VESETWEIQISFFFYNVQSWSDENDFLFGFGIFHFLTWILQLLESWILILEISLGVKVTCYENSCLFFKFVLD